MREEGSFDDFCEFMTPWLDGFEINSFDQHYRDKEMVLDLYYKEHGSTIPKEIVWAGDGIQIWLQILYHVYRTRDRDTVILDEPEVYLHPDLQRKLVQMLDETGRQIVVATHSSEVVAEADPKLVTLIERGQKRARHADENSDLEMLSKALGTAFNLRLAKALRSRTALFVVLDHDYRPPSVSKEVEAEFAAEDIVAHVWKRKELESYLLTSSVIARITKLSNENVGQMLREITLAMEDHVFAQMLSERMQLEKPTGKHASTITEQFKKEFDEFWKDPEVQLYACPAKDVIAELNKRLQGSGKKAVSARALASSHLAYEISSEMVALLRHVEETTL